MFLAVVAMVDRPQGEIRAVELMGVTDTALKIVAKAQCRLGAVRRQSTCGPDIGLAKLMDHGGVRAAVRSHICGSRDTCT